LDIFTLSQINPNLREPNASSKGSRGNNIKGKPVSKAKLTNNHDNWLDFQDSQESIQNDSSEHSLMEFIRAPQKSSFSHLKQIEEEADEEGPSKKKAQIPQELFSGIKDKKNKFFHDDWLESGPESKKSTPGKDWQIKAQNFQAQNQFQFQKKDNLLTDKLLLHDKKYQDKKDLSTQLKSPSRRNPREEEENEDSFGFESAEILREEKKKVVLKKSSTILNKPETQGKESFGKQIWNIQEAEEQEIVYTKATGNESLSVMRKKVSSDKESKNSKGATLTNPIEIEDFKSVPEKRKRGRPRKVDHMELPVVSISSKVNLTPVDLFKDMGIYPLKKVKKTPQVKPLKQNAQENLRKLLDVFIDKNSFNE